MQQRKSESKNTELRQWLAVVTLALGTFAIVTTELAPIGLLTTMARDLGESEAAIGWTVTVYAWIGAVCALLASVSLGRVPRKFLLVALMLGLALSNGAATLADSYFSLLSARVIGAIGHGVFWATIGSVAAQLVAAKSVGLATSIVFGGVSVASSLGVPLANFIAQLEGWRVVFGGVAGLCVVVGLLIALLVPAVPSAKLVGRQALRAVLGRRELWAIYGATAFAVTAHFSAYTYIEPTIRQSSSVPLETVALLLFSFGGAGVLGNILTGIYADQNLKTVLVIAISVMSCSMVLLGNYGTNGSMGMIVVLLLAWGASIAAVFVGFQTWVLKVAGEAAMPASAVYVAIFNASIGVGASLGGLTISYVGVSKLTVLAGLVGVFCVFIVLFMRQREKVVLVKS